MNLNFNKSLIERMNEGVFLLDKHADIKAYNAAARCWLQDCIGLAVHLREQIQSEASGQLVFPTKIHARGSWGDNPSTPVEAWLCKDGTCDYALLITQPGTQQELKSRETRFVALIGDQLRQEMGKLRDLLAKAAVPGTLNRPAILQQSARVDRALLEIDQLSVLFQRDKVFLEDRLSLIPLLKGILPYLPNQRGEQAISYTLIETLNSLGVLYGDADWLKYAFRNLLSMLGESAPPQSEVILELRQLGDFIVFTSRVLNAPGSRPEDSHPLSHEDTSRVERDIHLQMCHRIVELHGGRLKISMATDGDSDDYSNGIESFTLNLLTGIPDHDRSRASCSECRYVLQTQAYAKDLSELMATTTH